MIETQNQYIGDDKMIKMLEYYACPTPLEVVRMRFAGAVCSPNMDLRPSDVISSLWPSGQSPRLQTKEEADLFFKYFMGLWDEMFASVKANKIHLEKVSDKDVAAYCERRYAEVEQGYVEGFWGGRTDVKIPQMIADMIDSLSNLADMYIVLGKKAAAGAKTSEVVQALHYIDIMTEKAIAFIIEKSVLPRIESLRREVC